jgi:hypothetical protein
MSDYLGQTQRDRKKFLLKFFPDENSERMFSLDATPEFLREA